jgi:hypothetical protein
MAADTTILQGEVNENPEAKSLDVERLLAALLSSLLNEQRQLAPSVTAQAQASAPAEAQA